MKVIDVYNAINTLAPFSLAEEWDNCGLLIGSLEMDCSTAVVCLDVTNEVINQAIENKAELIISHHPVIFDPIKSIGFESKIVKLIKNNISVISAHTNLDIAQNGVNDTLCEKLGLKINESFAEGFGRICTLEKETNAEDLARMVKEKLDSKELTFINAKNTINKVAICSGSGSSLVQEVIDKKADAYITGELKHNVMLELYEENISVIMAGHFSTEVVIAPALAKKLNELLPEITFVSAIETPLVSEV